jgi:hypothetical protein
MTGKSLGYGIQQSVATVRCSADIHMEGLNKTKMTFKRSFVQHTQDKMANFQTSFLYADLLLITLDNVRLSWTFLSSTVWHCVFGSAVHDSLKDYDTFIFRAKISWRLTLILLTWRIWWAPNNASKWQIGFNSAFKGLTHYSPLNVRNYSPSDTVSLPRRLESAGTLLA